MVGDTLRQERERLGLTIKDVERGTSIRALYIEAIEKGDYQTLPGEVYTKGFIRNYANFLKIDANACVRQYASDVHADMPMENKASEEDRQGDTTPAKKTQKASSDFRMQREKANHQQNYLLIGALAAILVFAGAFYFLFFSGDDAETAKKPVQTKVETKAVAKEAPPEEKKIADHVELMAKFTDRCWISVTTDGEPTFEGIVEKGETMSWEGKDKLAVVVGNAGAVEFSCNGKDLGKPGADGEVAEKVFKKDDLKE